MSLARPVSLFRPAEWARHARTILAWPGPNITHYREFPDLLREATQDVSNIAEAVSRFEPVTLLVSHERLRDAQKRFSGVSHTHDIRLHPISANDVDLWMRDIGPTFTLKRNTQGQKNTLHGVDFNFNGWGCKYRTDNAAALASTFLLDSKTPRVVSSIVTEGGAIEVDGEGTVLATESSIINENRNPGKSRLDVEVELQRTLGVKKVIWIPGIKDADTTDCHIDAQARFVRPGTILLSKPSDADQSVWRRVYDETRQALSQATDAHGRQLELLDISEPDLSKMGLEAMGASQLDEASPVFSYVNYLLVNGGIILPQFGDRNADDAAVETVKRIFGKERDVALVNLQVLPFLGGGIHCASQEIPLA